MPSERRTPNFSEAVLTCLFIIGIVMWPSAAAMGQAPPRADRSGTLPDGQEWQITVPDNWNGVVINDLDRVTQPQRATFLLARGYAYTGTRRHADRGSKWDPRAESNNMARVLDIFESEFGRPKYAIQFGCSGGGSTGLSVAEDHPDRFDGVIAMHASTPVTLANMRLDLTFALKALLDPNDKLPLIVGPASVSSAEAVWVEALAAAQTTAQGRARMALAGVLAQYPVWGSEANPPATKLAATDAKAAQAAFIRVVFDGARRAVTSRPQWDQPAGLASWNTGIDYRDFFARVHPEPKRIVDALYAEAGLNLQSDLERINAAPRVSTSEEAVNYWRSRTHTGRIGVPLLHISGIGDAGTPPANMSPYQAAVRRAGRQPLYQQAFIDAAGHCTFNVTEMGVAIATMLHRLETGAWGDFATAPKMNAVARGLGTGEARFIDVGLGRGSFIPSSLNRAFFPDSPGPSSN